MNLETAVFFFCLTALASWLYYLFSRPSGSELRSKVRESKKEAEEIQQLIDQLKKESTRATIDYETARRRYYAKYGRKPSGGSR
jgi:hypothetical protein